MGVSMHCGKAESEIGRELRISEKSELSFGKSF